MFFNDADEVQIGYLRCILCGFEVVSGLNINLRKSEMYNVGVVPSIDSLAWILGCKKGIFLTSYFGFDVEYALEREIKHKKMIKKREKEKR